MTARMTASQVHPFSFPSLLSFETDFIRKSNAMAAGVLAFFFFSSLSLFLFFSFWILLLYFMPQSRLTAFLLTVQPLPSGPTSVKPVSLVLYFVFEFMSSKLSCFCNMEFKLERYFSNDLIHKKP